MEVFEADVRLRMLAHEFLQVAAHVVEPDGIDCGHPHPACHLFVERPHLVLKGVVAVDDLPAAVEKDLPLAGGRERPLRPLDQLHSEPVFQLAHDLAGAGLRNAVVLSRAGKTAARHDVAEDFQGLEVHDCRGARIRGRKPAQISQKAITLPSLAQRNHEFK